MHSNQFIANLNMRMYGEKIKNAVQIASHKSIKILQDNLSELGCTFQLSIPLSLA